MEKPHQDQKRIQTMMQFFDNAFHRVLICLERLELYLEVERLDGKKPALPQKAIGTERDVHNDAQNNPCRDTYFGELQGQCMTLSIQSRQSLKYVDSEEHEQTIKFFYKDLLEWYGARDERIPYNEVEASIVPIMLALNHQSSAKDIDATFEKYVAKTLSMKDLTDDEQREAIKQAMEEYIRQMEHIHNTMHKMEEFGDMDIKLTEHGRGKAIDGYKRLFDALVNLYDETVPAKVFVHTISHYLPEIASQCPSISEDAVDSIKDLKKENNEQADSSNPEGGIDDKESAPIDESKFEKDIPFEPIPQEPKEEKDGPKDDQERPFFIDPKEDVYTENGVTYHKLIAVNPIEKERGMKASPHNWLHSDDDCNGQLYIGDNGVILCGKCGKKQHVTYCSFNAGQQKYVLSFVGQNKPDVPFVLGIVSSMAVKTGIEWLNKCINSIEKK